MGHRVTTLNVNTIEPAGATLTIGADGDSVVLADDVKSNTYKDAGGNTLFVSNGSGVLSSVNSGFGDSLKLLSTQTASRSASIEFTSGIDSTYKEYVFKFINLHPGATSPDFLFGTNAVGETGFNEVITSTFFEAYHTESDSAAALSYVAGYDLAQGVGSYGTYQILHYSVGSTSDNSVVGELHLLNPASTTYVKHFYAKIHTGVGANATTVYVAGYINTTAAIDEIKFLMRSGNIDAGKIKMWGVK